MTLEIAFLFALLAVMVALFLTERLPVEVTAFSGLAVLVFAGYLGPAEAFTGFSSPAVITMLSVFLLSGGLQQTGVAELLGDRLHALGRGREVPLMVVIMLVAGGLSAFMNNVAATAVLLPAVASICRRAGIAPSRLLIPLAFGAILGGTTTLVGTPPNILAAEVLVENDLPPFELFDFAPLGLVLLGTGVLFMVTVGRRLLPVRSPRTVGPGGAGGDLPRLYRLQERLFSLQVPEGSPLDGSTLREARLGTTLRIQVVALVRNGRRRLAPDPDVELRGGDLLLVEGELDELRELLELQGIEPDETPPRLTATHGAADAARLRLTGTGDGAGLAGRTLEETAFRQRYGVVVARLERDGTVVTEELATTRLEEGDELLVVGAPERLDELAQEPGIELVERGPEVLERVEQGLFLLRVPPRAPLVGNDLRGARLGELVGLTVVGVIREGETRLAIESDEPIRGGDRLLASGAPSRILALLQIGDLDLEPEA
ncbi:MAG: SLC13 family permease, partial [Acidobacteriota bacterium]